ncbi:ribosomal RNA small subunit methyltransferase A [candidate division KSB3 bacterium]|uniref:Ribosomal RNA small subunit methyltransferase A n=1 Tax=candidate division KSB3 bacterium TaxID=2044937 RepID=A0A2G6E5M7_9BACT|nr:MAG: ribosomal RNA small subunit methyltransferase A [candidate division KSB3 bacterium]PIE29751.1 MAG: ribosomal RNA small subunit methyltransferase A [candidate division KSB3 bacterium]
MRQRLGQHFLVDPRIVEGILAETQIAECDCVVEIGAGKGVLTEVLVSQARFVVAIEYDQKLTETLQARFAAVPDLRILHADARSMNYAELFQKEECLGRKMKVIANLPYYAATPILLSLFESARFVYSCTLMFQKEVAERISASPGSKAYGTLSVLAQYYSEVRYCFSVPPEAFCPPPKVDSAVVHLRFSETPRADVVDRAHFFTLVKAAFIQRRKTLKNALVKGPQPVCSRERLVAAFHDLGFDDRIRGENLSLHDFARLSNQLSARET